MPNGVVADLLTLVPVAATLRVVERSGRVSRRKKRKGKREDPTVRIFREAYR